MLSKTLSVEINRVFNYLDFSIIVIISQNIKINTIEVKTCCLSSFFFNRYGIAVSNAEFGIGNGPNNIGKIDCRGNETDIMTCSFKKMTCSHHNNAGVICSKFIFLRLR